MEQSPNNGTKKVKLLCSYGGQIKSRPSDHHLSYLGDTKIVAVDRAVKILPILRQAQIPPLRRRRDIVKYQLPGEDLDALVSLIDDDDVEHMIDRVVRPQCRGSPQTRPPPQFVLIIPRVKPVARQTRITYSGSTRRTSQHRQTPLDLFPVPPGSAMDRWFIGYGCCVWLFVWEPRAVRFTINSMMPRFGCEWRGTEWEYASCLTGVIRDPHAIMVWIKRIVLMAHTIPSLAHFAF
ncbi:hypothetical protein SASPL_157088 [Salvia splendens]|uniref:PB1 domain-containing protein n=1 Tax=Salvia splendens TaxID=180675 RepID=A0A8X8VVK4_SALSN|nr:hypothetical protein SASPL_157088 [Salvia splendens]